MAKKATENGDGLDCVVRLLHLKPICPLCETNGGECKFQMSELVQQLGLNLTHPLCYLLVKSTAEGGGILHGMSSGLIHLKYILPLWNNYGKCSTGVYGYKWNSMLVKQVYLGSHQLIKGVLHPKAK